MATSTVRMRHPNGTTVRVRKEKAETLGGMGFTKSTSSSRSTSTQAEPEGYAALTVEGLKDEIRSRNENRDEEAHLSTTGNKAELIAALEADDESSD